MAGVKDLEITMGQLRTAYKFGFTNLFSIACSISDRRADSLESLGGVGY
jgi:hypothetical protein